MSSMEGANEAYTVPWHKLRALHSFLAVPKNEFALLFFLVLLATVLRTIYNLMFVGLDAPPEYDGIVYDLLAINVLEGKGYSNQFGLTAAKPPLYSLFLAATYVIVGHNYAVVRTLQVVLSAAACLGVYYLGKMVLGRTVGLLAALGAVVHPLLIYVTGLLYAETLFLFLLVIALLFLVRAVQRERAGASAAGGLLLGLVILTRPGIVTFVPFMFLTFLLVLNWRKGCTYALLMSACVALVLLPWMLRNYAVFGGFVPLTTEGGSTLWATNNPLADGGAVEANEQTWNGPPPPPTRGWAGWAELNERESSARFVSQALLWITEHPGDFLKSLPKKVARLWSPAEYTVHSDRPRSELVSNLVILPYVVFLGLIGYGIISSRREWRLLSVLYGLVVSTNFNAMLYGGGTRFSVPMIPALLIFAAMGCTALVRLLAESRWNRGHSGGDLP